MSVLGLDVGTSSVKAVRFDADWRAADSATEPTVVRRDVDGGAEQDMADVWAAAARVLSALAARSPDTITLVAVTAQGDGCWLVDADGSPVGPALLWNDARAAGVVDAWQSDGTAEKAFRISGSLVAPGLACAQLRWLLEHDPDRIQRARRLLSCGSWIYARLTGRHVLELSDAANPLCAAASGEYASELVDLFGLGAVSDLLPPIVTGPDRVAPLTAPELGIPSGTPVALAPYDVVATAVGTGAVRSGRAVAILGTTLCVGEVTETPALDRAPNGMTLPMPTARRWLIAYATMIGTEVLDWSARLLRLPDAAALIRLAGESRRPDLPLFLPYLSPAGERSPFLDPTIRGTITGLDLTHTPSDVASATVEGLTFAVVDCIRALPVRPASVALSGGGARSEAWCRLISDAAGLPVVRPDVEEVGARGAALVGAVDAGHFPSLEVAAATAVRPGATIEPDPERAARLAGRYSRFRAVRDSGSSRAEAKVDRRAPIARLRGAGGPRQ